MQQLRPSRALNTVVTTANYLVEMRNGILRYLRSIVLARTLKVSGRNHALLVRRVHSIPHSVPCRVSLTLLNISHYLCLVMQLYSTQTSKGPRLTGLGLVPPDIPSPFQGSGAVHLATGFILRGRGGRGKTACVVQCTQSGNIQ